MKTNKQTYLWSITTFIENLWQSNLALIQDHFERVFSKVDIASAYNHLCIDDPGCFALLTH